MVVGICPSVTLMLVIGWAQSDGPADFWPIRILNEFFDALVNAIEIREASGMMNQIRHGDPTVYVDGQRVALPPRHGSAFKFDVDVPGEGIYAFILTRHRESEAGLKPATSTVM